MRNSFFQTPEFLSLPLFGLSISPSFVRIVKLKKSPQGLIPELVDEVTFSETCSFFQEDGTHTECDQLKTALLQLKKKHKIIFAQLSIPEETSYVFKIMIPKEAIGMIEQFISNNMEQQIPLTSSEVYFDYKILKSHITDALIPVVVTAIPRIIIEKYSSLLESCGIFMVGSEPETHAITRCVISKGDINPYIVLNINEYATSISVVQEGLVQYTQTLTINSFDIQSGITPDIAATLKDTINRVIIYWFTSKEKTDNPIKIENIILTGVNIDSPEFINFFESNLSVNVSVAQVWKNCFDIQEYIPSISKKDSLKYATCIGLSLFKLK